MGKTQNQQQVTRGLKLYRRTVVNWLWAFAATLACIEFSWVAGSLLRSGKDKTAQEGQEHLIDAMTSDSLQPGEVRAVPAGALYIARLNDGSFLALSRTCTHLGCSIPWDEKLGRFTCPCHGSSFDLTGTVLTAPAVRPLDYFPIRIENGLLRVDVRRPLKRERFDPSQAVRL